MITKRTWKFLYSHCKNDACFQGQSVDEPETETDVQQVQNPNVGQKDLGRIFI
jgi:hypothetical protein